MIIYYNYKINYSIYIYIMIMYIDNITYRVIFGNALLMNMMEYNVTVTTIRWNKQ